MPPTIIVGGSISPCIGEVKLGYLSWGLVGLAEPAAMGSPISPLIANLFMEEFEVKALSSAPHPLFLDKVHTWQQPTTTATYQHTRPTDTIHCGVTGLGGASTNLVHLNFSMSQQHPHHLSLKKAHTHRSISTLGKQSLHHSKIKCFQHFST